MSWKTEFFGEELLTKAGMVKTADTLAAKKLIGIYFSAHWCPPCRGFTPVLATFFEDMKEDDEGHLEIVFVSSDKTDAAFMEYYGEMPWTALPFTARTTKQNLASKFGIRGIPAFIVLDGETGEVRDASARDIVASSRGDIEKVKAKWGI